MAAVPIIIIADPDPMVSNALRVELTGQDCAVILASTSKEAEEYAAQAVAELIVLDVTRMKLNGYAACARIRHRNGYAARPIVLTAAEIQPRDTEAAKKAGATLLLAKPYSVNGLVQAVTPFLAGDDPLRTHLPRQPYKAQIDWTKEPDPSWRFGADSGLSRNGAVLPIVRGKGVRVPLIRAT
jgi:DNA-binding response OmpR family regulator